MAVTIPDVAKRSGVAVGTVFRYLNGAKLREENRLKVEKAIEELGFKENVLAVAVIIEQLTDIFATSVITTVERTLEKQKYNIIISDFEKSAEKLEERLKFFKNRAISGLILFSSGKGAHSIDILREYRAANIPIVVVDDRIPGFETDVVLVDNAHASFRAVERLIHANHHKIAVLTGSQHSYVSQERLRGYAEAMKTYNIPAMDQWTQCGDFTTEGGYTAVKKLFQSASSAPTAIYSTNYYMTLGAIIALNELGVKIPEALSFIGFDRFTALDSMTPLLTVIEQPLDDLGRTAGKLMMKRIKGNFSDFPRTIKLKTKMCMRHSIRTI